MKKVLIVSYYFPPYNMIASKRYGTMCKYFKENGYDPYVITTRHDKHGYLDVGMDLDVPMDEAKIIRIGHAKSNSEIRSVFGELLVRTLDDKKLLSRTITIESVGWYEKVKKELDIRALEDVDIVIGTYPPMGNLFVAKYLAKRLGCPYLVDVRDLISDYMETEAGYKRSQILDRVVERYVLGNAAAISTVTPGFRNILKKRFPQKPAKVVFNGWDQPRNQVLEDKPQVGDRYLYYAGALYEHRLSSFELLVDCIKKINEKQEEKLKFIVRSVGPKQLDMKLKKIVWQKHMQEYVHVYEAALEDVVRKEQDEAYINVVLHTVRNDDASLMSMIPAKVYELLQVKAAVLAIAPEDSDLSEILRRTKKGIATVSENEITDFILSGHKDYSGNQKIAFFTRKKQAERLCGFMDAILGNR